MKQQCGKEAEICLRIDFYARPDTTPAIAYVSIFVCREHQMPDEETKQFILLNFETMCVGFVQVGKIRPDPNITKWAWAPIAEAEAFEKESEGKNIKRMYKN